MEQFVALGIRGDLLAQINKFRKVQEAFFVSSITAANGRSIKSNCITDWRDSHETDLGKHRSKYPYGREYPTNENRNKWKISLSRLTLPNFSLFQPLG